MNRRPAGLSLTLVIIVGVVLLPSGCGPGPAYQQGRQAEQKGNPQLAYDDYCQAGRTHAGNGEVADGIKRTGPAAAAGFRAQAQQAEQEGRYADAWRLLMRALEIRPDDKNTAEAIRRLQEQHGTEIADARADWLRRGSPALALAKPAPTAAPATSGPAGAAEQLVMANPAPAEPSAKPSSPKPPDTTKTRRTESKQRVRKEAPEAPPPQPPADEPGMTESQRQHRQWAEAFIKAEKDREQKAEQEKREQSKPTKEKPAAQPPPPPPAPQAPRVAAQPSVQPVGQPYPNFLVVRTLSKKDRRFPSELPLIDGITVKLNGTDDDPKASFDLYDGKKRLMKCRGMKLGAAVPFRGRSGTAFRVSLLSIYDKMQSIRLGVSQDLAAISQ